MNSNTSSQGICYLVGAGPGDIGLVTLKAKACLEKADVLVYDALSHPDLVTWVPENCEIIYAGKRADQHALTQDQINATIVEKTKEGKCVIRLKGGDPMIFGRGGEEAAELAELGLKFEIVPGISSSIAGPAYAGIPVTHRSHCSQLTLFTGHEDPTKEDTSLDYQQIAQARGTKVFLMGVSRMAAITKTLIEHGANPDEPMALVRWATTNRQESLVGTLSTMAELVKKNNFKSPAVAVIGGVVNEREKINWFEQRPLLGKRIVVTRTRQQSSALKQKLVDLGAEVIEIPTIRMVPASDQDTFNDCIENAYTYDWIVFTSPNGVEYFLDRFFERFDDARSLGGVKIAAIGPGTAKKIKQYHFATDLIPEVYHAEGLIEAFKKEDIDHHTMLYVKPKQTRDILTPALRDMNAIVDECVVYETVAETRDITGAKQRLIDEGADLITFTSSSTAEHFKALNLPLNDDCKVACMGPITSQALGELGYTVDVISSEATINAFVEAIVDHFNPTAQN